MREANDQVIDDREATSIAMRNMALKPADAATVLREVGRAPALHKKSAAVYRAHGRMAPPNFPRRGCCLPP